MSVNNRTRNSKRELRKIEREIEMALEASAADEPPKEPTDDDVPEDPVIRPLIGGPRPRRPIRVPCWPFPAGRRVLGRRLENDRST